MESMETLSALDGLEYLLRREHFEPENTQLEHDLLETATYLKQDPLAGIVNKELFRCMREYIRCRKFIEAKDDVYNYFFTQLSKIATTIGIKYIPIRLETVGSRSEGLGFLANDVDILAIYDNKVASVCFPFSDITLTEEMFVIDTQDCHKGYCRLKFHRGNRRAAILVYDPRDIMKRNRDIFIRNSMNTIILEAREENAVGPPTSIHGPALTFEELKCDWVFALECKNPQHLIKSYLERKRHWPNKDVLSKLMDIRYTVVAAKHPNSEEPTLDFRLSFASAEKYLIRQLSDNQFACYYFLKLIKGKIEKDQDLQKDTLKSYYVKTAFLWICEKLEPDVWSDENFLLCVSVCLLFLQHCFHTRTLPQLFVTENNLIDHMLPEDCKKIADAFGSYVLPKGSKMFLRCVCDEKFDELFDALMSRPRRNLQSEIHKLLIETSTSEISVEHIFALMEAGTTSFTLGELGTKDNKLVYQALATTITDLERIVSVNMIACIRSLLCRLFADYLQRTPSLRSVSEQVEIFYNVGISLTYPVSLYDDRGLSGMTNLALFHYLQGNPRKALVSLWEIEPILYNVDPNIAVAISFVPNDLERTYRDEFLSAMITKFGTYLEVMHVKCNVVALYIFLKCIECSCSNTSIRSQGNRLRKMKNSILFNEKHLQFFDKKTRLYTSLVLDAATAVLRAIKNRIH